MSDWEEGKLGDVLTIKYGKDHKTLGEGKIPVLGSGGIMRYADKYLYDKKSILIPRKGSLNNIMYRDEPFWTVDTMFWTIVDEDKVAPKYLFYQLTQIDFNSLNVGSAVPSLTVPVINEIDVTLPPLPEQKTIAFVLSSLDDKIDLLHRQNQTLEAMAEALFKEWFVLNVKEDWKEKPLDEVAIYLNGLACQKFPPKDEVNKLPVLKIKDLQNGISASSDWVSSEVPKTFLVKNGDVIFSWSASLLVKIWDGEDCILNQHLFKVTSGNYPKWFYYLWTTHYLDEFIAVAKSHATTMGHIKRSDLKQAMVKVPTEKEIIDMDKHFTPIIDKIISNNKQTKTLIKLRDNLLPKLMTGEVRVNL